MAERVEVVPMGTQPIAAVDEMSGEEYLQWLAQEGIELAEFTGGSEWDVVEKVTLIGVPFIIAGINFNDDGGRIFVSVRAFLKDGKKVVFNDGGTGIKEQLKKEIEKTGRSTGIACAKGLRVSHYSYTDSKGAEHDDGETFYIA